MAVTIVHASISENGNAGWDGKAKAGDQTGREVCTRSWYAKAWNVMLHYPDASIRKKAAEIAVKLAKSGLVGYNQSKRNTLYQKLKKYNWDVDAYIRSGEKSETDCSAFIYAVFACLLAKIRSDGNAPTTSTMRSKFSSWGFSVYTSSKYLTGDSYLEIGDILVKEGSHTVMATTAGKNAPVSGAAYTGAYPKLPARGYFKYGDGYIQLDTFATREEVKKVQRLAIWVTGVLISVDGEYGPETYALVKKMQGILKVGVDGEYGRKTDAAAKGYRK